MAGEDLDIRVAEAFSGKVYTQLGLSAMSTGADLAKALASQTGVRVKNQIILCGPPFKRLDLRRPIIGMVSRSIFLFDRTHLFAKYEAVIPNIVLSPGELDIPSPPTSQTLSRSSEDSSPLIKALTDYTRHLEYHKLKGHIYARGASDRAQSITECAEQIRVQGEALKAAMGNLEQHAHTLSKSFDRFHGEFQAQQRKQSTILDAAEEDLAALQSVGLHSALQTKGRTTLLDCVPETKLKTWSKQCGLSHASLGKKVAKLKTELGGVCTDVSSALELSVLPSDDAARLATYVSKAQALVEETAELDAKLSKDCSQGAGIIDTTVRKLPTVESQSTEVLDACRVLEQLHQTHQTRELPALAQNDSDIHSYQRSVASLHAEMSVLLVKRLKEIAVLQSRIRDHKNRLAVLKESAVAQESAVGELIHVRCMPLAYEACIEEVKFRQRYFQNYFAQVEFMAEHLYQLCDKETKRREMFLRKHGVHLPRDLIAGLNERPLPAEVRARDFDVAIRKLKLSTTDQTNLHVNTGSLQLSPAPRFGDNANSGPQDKIKQLELENSRLRAELASLKAQAKTSLESDAFHVPLTITPKSGVGSGTLRSHGFDSVQSMTSVSMTATEKAAEAKPPTGSPNGLSASTSGLQIAGQLREIHELVSMANIEDFDWTLPREQVSLGATPVASTTLVSADGTVVSSTDASSGGASMHSTAHESSNPISSTKKAVARLLKRHRHMRKRITELEGKVARRDKELLSKLAYRKFRVNDVALFLPMQTPDRTTAYLCFNERAPHRYLSDDTVRSLRVRGRYPDYVLGRILMMEEHAASLEFNPYHLRLGTQFFILTVERVISRVPS